MKVFAATLLFVASVAFAQQPAAKPGAITCKAEPAAKSAASAAFTSEHFADAEALYTTDIAASPSVPEYAGLVESQIEESRLAESLASAKAAAAAFPASGEALALIGEAQLRAGLIDDAAASFAAARKMDFCSARAHFGLARLDQLSALNASAQKELAIAHKLSPGDARISEAYFLTLPPAVRAQGFKNLLASSSDMPPAHRQLLENEAALLGPDMTCKPAVDAGTFKVPLTILYYSGVEIRDFAIRANFPGKNSVNLELDSTASGILLSQTDASRLHITSITGGSAPPFVAAVPSLELGGIHYTNCAVTVVSDASLANRYSVIGTDFFRDSLIHIDWVAKLMTLSAYPGPVAPGPVDASVPPAEKEWSRVLVDGHRILLPTLINKKPAGFFLLDTSYVTTTISPAVSAPLSPTPDSTVDIFGVDGPVVRFFRKEAAATPNQSDLIDENGAFVKIFSIQRTPTFRFAGNEKLDVSALTFDLTPSSHAAGIEVSGIFGYRLLQRYFTDIDYRNGLVRLNLDLMYQFREEDLHPGVH